MWKGKHCDVKIICKLYGCIDLGMLSLNSWISSPGGNSREKNHCFKVKIPAFFKQSGWSIGNYCAKNCSFE